MTEMAIQGYKGIFLEYHHNFLFSKVGIFV